MRPNQYIALPFSVYSGVQIRFLGGRVQCVDILEAETGQCVDIQCAIGKEAETEHCIDSASGEGEMEV